MSRIYWTARSQTWIMFADFQLTERNSTRGEEVEVGRGGIELELERQELRTRRIVLELGGEKVRGKGERVEGRNSTRD